MSASAQESTREAYSLFFRVGKSDIDSTYRENGKTISLLSNQILYILQDKDVVLDSLSIFASTSPEGSGGLNKRLALARAEAARELISGLFPEMSLDNLRMESKANDWTAFMEHILENADAADREAVLKILNDTSIVNKEAALRSLPQLYAQVQKAYFERMRLATISFSFSKAPQPVLPVEKPDTLAAVSDTSVIEVVPQKEDTLVTEVVSEEIPELKPYYMAAKTNLIYDAVMIPNIGLEFYLGGNISVAGNWMYSWWKNDPKAWYWRTYGGDIALRYWFGKAAEAKPLSGHHLGIYGQILTYDFEVGDMGYLGDKWSWAVGAEYGYSLPVAKRLNIDFNLGIGYLTGEFKEYLPIDGHYVWQATKQRHWIGPTKAEISLVWLLGRGNENVKKGGKR